MKAEIKTVGTKKFAIEEYTSVQELAAENRARKHVRGENNAFTRTNDGWIGAKSYAEAEAHMLGGWVGEIEAVKKVAARENRKVESKRITSKNDVVGFAPIVPLAIIGVPQSMINTSYRPMKGKVIDLYYNITMHSGTPAATIAKNGAMVMGAAIALEKRGYRVRMSAVQTYCGNGKTGQPDGDMLVVRVKSENQPLEIKRCMFPMTHPAMFRSIGFGWYERFPLGTDRWGYGRSFDYQYSETERESIFEAMFGKQATYISGTRAEALGSSEAIAEYIMKGGK